MSIMLPGLPGLGDAINPIVNPTDATSAESLKAQRAYAQALMTGNVVKGTGPQFPVVQSWTQGVSNMVNALLGGGEAYQANQREKTIQDRIANSTDTTPSLTPTKTSFSEGPSSEDHETADGSPESKAIASIESKGSGDYSAVGPQTRTGDRAYGKYQVMGANIPLWTEEVLGKKMTPDEFLKDPKAQDAVFTTKFAQGGDNNNDRASVWFTGKPYAQGAGRSDGNLTGAQYVDRFNRAMPSQATAFAGPDAAAPAVQAMSAALRGDPTQVAENTQLAAGKAAPAAGRGPMPMPNGQDIYVDPRLVQRRPQLSQTQIRDIMSNPGMDMPAKLGFLNQYQQQNQPIDVPYPGGVVRINPLDPRQQQFIPDLQKGVKKIGEIEVPNFSTVAPNPNGPGLTNTPATTMPSVTVGPRSEAMPPVVAPTGAPAAPAAVPGPAVAETPSAPPAAPVQVASNDPTAGLAAAAAGAAGNAPAAVPPAAVPAVAAAATQTNPLAKMAAGPAPPGIAQEDWDMYTGKKSYDKNVDLQQEAAKAKIGVDAEASKDANKLNSKRYEDMMANVSAAADQRNNISTARALTNDPNFYAGLGNGVVENWKRLKSALGVDPDAAAPMEVFKKTTAQSIMAGLKSAFGGLGQIRVAEIRLQELANASTSNTPTAIKALLEITDRNAQKTQQIGEMASAYKAGDAVVDPTDPSKILMPANKLGPDGEPIERNGLDAHWDRLVHQYQKDHPTFSKEEYDNFANVLKGKPGEVEMPGKADATPTGAAPAVGTEKEFDTPGGGKVTGVWDGKTWNPKK